MTEKKRQHRKALAQRVFSSLFLILLAGSISAQERFQHLSIKDGLSNNSISNIIQSKDGYLWFGTLNGLNRYDGKEIRSYTYEPGNENSLSSNRIYYLLEDSLNYIWILTYEFQVLRFDPQTEKFININSLLPPGKFSGRARVELYSSSPSIVWVASEDGGIFRIKQHKGSDELKIDYFTVNENTSSEKETFIYKDSDSKIWIGTHKGLMVLKNDSADFSELTKNNNHQVDTRYYFRNCLEIKKGYYIFGTASQGLFEFRNNRLKRWHVLPDSNLYVRDIEPGKNGDFVISTQGNGFYHVTKDLQITNYKTKKIKDYHKTYCDQAGTYWFSTPLRGISMFNPETKVLHHYDLNSEMRESLGDPDKPRLLEDKNGTIWIGIYGGGLCRFDRNKQDFRYYYHQKNNSFSLSSNFILTLFEDKSNNLWIGTFKNGLNKLNLSQNKFQYKELVKNANYESQNEVRCIIEDDKDRIWVGTKFGDIYCCDKNNNILFKIPDNLSNKTDYIRSNIYALLTDGNDLWVGTKGNGLYHIKEVLDFEKYPHKRFDIDIYKRDLDNPASIPSNDIFSLLQDQYGQIWISTYHGGLSVIKNPSVNITFTNYQADAADSTSISDNRIRKIYRDRNNNLWFGTVHGLNYLDSRYISTPEKVFKRFYKNPANANSLANNDIFDIHQDLNGTIWVATYGGGLNSITYIGTRQRINHFFRKDGLSSDIVFSILEDDKLNLWLGTDNGLGKFSTKDHSFELIDEDDGYGHGIFSEGCKYKSNNGEFLFGTLNGFIRFAPDSINSKKETFPIVLTGFKLFDEIILPGTKRSPLKQSINNTRKIKLKHDQNFITINFAVMDFSAPDKIQYEYILQNYDKRWNKRMNNSSANYKRIPPGEYKFILKATNSKGIWMEDQTRELTIVITPPIWKTIWAYLIYLLVFIGLLYIFLSEVKIKNEITYENKLSEEKFKFFTSVSHEFKTPLTLINNSIDDISKATTFTKDVRNNITLAQRNVQSLNDLIEQLIDYRRLQKGSLDLKTRETNIVDYLHDIYLTFLPYAEKKKIKFLFNCPLESYSGWLDTRHIDKVVNNLLSNAFKHTPSNKKIVLDVNINEKTQILQIKVQDQGEGINKEDIDRIFDRFVLIEKNRHSGPKGSGIGLSLVRELVQLHKGTINLSSTPGEGSVFTVAIPIGEDQYEENEKVGEHETMFVQQPKPFYSKISNTEERKDTTSSQHIKSANAVRSKLLLIDDNQELRDYLHDKMKKDFTVFVATNGEEGIKLAEEVNPDIIITDLKMPKVDGISLTKHLKGNFETSHIPIILLTATSTIDTKIEGLESGADDYITKPFNLEYLKKRIINLVHQRSQLREKFSKEPGFKPEKLSTSNNDQKFLSQVIEIIETNIKKVNFNIEDMINELGYSRSAFFKKMKAV